MMRIVLFLATNLAVLLIASVTLKLLGVDRFTGQNYGAGLLSRCRKIFRITFLQGLGAMAAVCGTARKARSQLLTAGSSCVVNTRSDAPANAG